MKNKLITFFIVCCLPIFAGTYKLDNDLSRISTRISYLNTFPVEGSFVNFSGKLRTDRDGDLTRLEFKAETQDIVSFSEDMRSFIVGEDVLGADQHKKINFKSLKIVKNSENEGYLVTGILDFHGVASKIEFPMALNSVQIGSDEFHSFTVSIPFNREDLLMTSDKKNKDGISLLGPTLFLDLNFVFKS